MTSGIYQIRNTVNGHLYVGSSVNTAGRCRRHRKSLTEAEHRNRHLQNAWNLYGETAFVFEVLEEVTERERLIEREQYYIDSLQPEYNISLHAGNTLGVVCTEETRARIGAASKVMWSDPKRREQGTASLLGNSRARGHRDTEEQRFRKSLGHKGIIPSARTKEALRVANLGNKYTLGTKHSQATRDKQSEGVKAYLSSEEAKVARSKQTRTLWCCQEYRDKITRASTGKKHTKETRDRLSALKKAWWEHRRLAKAAAELENR